MPNYYQVKRSKTRSNFMKKLTYHNVLRIIRDNCLGNVEIVLQIVGADFVLSESICRGLMRPLRMSYFAYACKTEGKNGISCLISELLRTLDSSLRDHLFVLQNEVF